MEIVNFRFSDKKREKFTFTSKKFSPNWCKFISNRSIESDTKYHKSRFAIIFDFFFPTRISPVGSWVQNEMIRRRIIKLRLF